MGEAIVVADTSVVINFLRIGRMDLIGAHPSPFIVTDHVADEIADFYPEQQVGFRAALGICHVTQYRVDDPAEVEIFLRLAALGRLGVGERSAVAVALHKGYALAIDDSRAINRAIREAGFAGRRLTVLRTQDLMVQLGHAEIISVDAADVILLDWATNHGFRLKISSFADVL